jgi:hypothetical protein
VAEAVIGRIHTPQKRRLICPDREAALDQPIAVFFLFAAQEAGPIDAELRVPEVKATERPTRHHLARLLDDVHPSGQPKAHQLSDVFLIRERLRRYRGVVLIASLRVLEEPVLGIPRAPPSLSLLECGLQFNPLGPAEMVQ